MLKLLFDVIALHEGPIGKLNAIKTSRQRHDLRPTVDAAHLSRTGRFAHAKTLGHRDDRILQTLGRVHGHDAYRAVTLLVERARRLLARQEAIEGKRDGTRRVTELGLRLGHGVERLEHVGGDGLALGTTLRQTHKPARSVDHVARDGSERIATHATKRIAQHLAGARHERQILQARHIGIAHDAHIDIATRRLPRLVVQLGRQRQEFLSAERKHRRCQQRHKTLRRIGRIGKRAHQGTYRLHLGSLRKDRAACDDAVEPLVAEGLRIDIGVGHAAQQQHHAALGLAGIGKRAESLGDRTGLSLRALLRTAAGNKEGLATRGVCHQRVLAAVARLKIQKALHQAAVIAVEDACHVTQHLVMAAEVAHEFDELAGGDIRRGDRLGRRRRSHFALLATEHLDLCPAEAVDRLLCIAYGAQRALPRTRQVTDQVDLHLVGILKLVDHDHLKASLICRSNGRVVAQRLVCHAEQVVVVEGRLAGLERAVLSLYRAGQAHQRIERGTTAGKHDIDKRIGGLGLEQLDLLLGERLARARHGARHHESRRIGHGLAARLERVDSIECRLRLLGRGLACAQRRAIGIGECRGIGLAARHAHIVHTARQLTRQLQQVAHQTLDGRAGAKGTALARHGIPGVEGLERCRELGGGIGCRRATQHMLNSLVHKLVGIGEHRELGIDAQLQRVCAQDARAHAVNGRDPRIVDGQGLLVHALVDERAAHAVTDLGRGIFGKGNGEHLVKMLDERTGFGRERVDDAAREGKGLARTGARRDKQRTVERFDDLQLLRHQSRKIHGLHVPPYKRSFVVIRAARMRGLSRNRVDGGNVACLELAQALGDAGLHAIEQGVEVHTAAFARKALLKARDATVTALFLEQLGARGTAQRRLAALGRKVKRRAGVQIQRPAHGLGVDERLGMWRQPARIVDGRRPRFLVAHRRVGELKLLNARAVLVVDHHGTILGVHVHAVDAPAKRPTGILNVKIVKGKLQVARGKGGKCLGLVGKHSLQLRQDLCHLALLHRRERHERALRASLAGVLGQRLVKDLAQQLLSARQILGRHAFHALLGQAGMQVLQHIVDKVALLHVAKARVDGLRFDAIRHEPAQRARRVRLNLRGGRQARHERRVLALAIAATQDQVRHSRLTQMLRSLARDALALDALTGRWIKIGDDTALAHARNPGGASGLGVRSKLGPRSRRIALTRLAIVRHAGKRNRAARSLHRAAEAHAQQGGGLKRHAAAI